MNIESQSIKEKLFKILLFLFCFSFPFGIAINNIFYGLLIVITIFYFSYSQVKKNIFNSLITILFLLYFIITALSLIYTEDINYGIKALIRLSPFLIFPLVILNFSDFFNRKLIEKCLFYFCLGLLISVVSCLIYCSYQTYLFGAFNPLNESNTNLFSYFNLTKLVGIHPIYFGVYILLGMSYLIVKLIENRGDKLVSTINISLLLLFLVFLFLLNSFMLIIILTFLSFFFLVYCIKNRIGTKLITIFLFLSIYPVYEASYFLQEKFKGINILEDITNKDFSGNDFTAIKARNAKASSSIDLIRINPLLGTGIGDAKKELLNQYKINGFIHGFEQEFNSHNQYLTTFISLGAIGLCILLFSIFLMLYESILLRNSFLFCFTVICTLFMLTESILERQFGIVFFSFFSVLLSYNYKSFKDEA